MVTKRGLPELFLERLDKIFGVSVSRNIKQTFAERPTTFRVNTIKAANTDVREALVSAGFKLQAVTWNKGAYILKNKSKRELTETELYRNGKIYLQSLASMVPPLVLASIAGEKVLDLTAAPGSKTSQLAALMNKAGELVANDNNVIRFDKLKHNMELLGVTEEKTGWKFSLVNDHGTTLVKKFPEYFNKILLDAPCSAEARFIEGVSSTYGYWSERAIKMMAYKQRQLLLSAWGALKPGGTLVYSTCTFAPEENELQIARLLERFPDAKLMSISIPDLKRAPIVSTWETASLPKQIQSTFRILPTKEIEGFFIAKIQKIKA